MEPNEMFNIFSSGMCKSCMHYPNERESDLGTCKKCYNDPDGYKPGWEPKDKAVRVFREEPKSDEKELQARKTEISEEALQLMIDIYNQGYREGIQDSVNHNVVGISAEDHLAGHYNSKYGVFPNSICIFKETIEGKPEKIWKK